jgi:hypothetical protein
VARSSSGDSIVDRVVRILEAEGGECGLMCLHGAVSKEHEGLRAGRRVRIAGHIAIGNLRI